MSKLRQKIAERLKESQNTAAILTTFNEVDMTAVMSTRNDYKEIFEKKHNVKLGFMSFFVKAVVTALKEIPAVTHVDGTARLQTVTEISNIKFYKLISQFKLITGIPILLNTSLNENEPIVMSPEDALNMFMRTKLDILVMQNYLILRK